MRWSLTGAPASVTSTAPVMRGSPPLPAHRRVLAQLRGRLGEVWHLAGIGTGIRGGLDDARPAGALAAGLVGGVVAWSVGGEGMLTGHRSNPYLVARTPGQHEGAGQVAVRLLAPIPIRIAAACSIDLGLVSGKARFRRPGCRSRRGCPRWSCGCHSACLARGVASAQERFENATVCQAAWRRCWSARIRRPGMAVEARRDPATPECNGSNRRAIGCWRPRPQTHRFLASRGVGEETVRGSTRDGGVSRHRRPCGG